MATHGDEKSIDLIKRSIDQLPDANRDSLAFLILHLKRVIEQSSVNRMGLNSMSRIFGPGVIGNSSPDAIGNVIAENLKQIQTMNSLLTLTTEYWEQTLMEPDIFKSKLTTNYT